MKKKQMKKVQAFLLLALTAAVLACLGIQKLENTSEKTVAEQALVSSYDAEIREQLEKDRKSVV